MDDQVMTELREFMRWTRDTLACVKGQVGEVNEKVHEIERHCLRQNGDIKIVMERERATHRCASAAHELADDNARAVAVLRATANAEREHDKEREGEMRREVDWLRENIWKLALGGVSLLALAEQVAEVVGKLSGSP